MKRNLLKLLGVVMAVVFLVPLFLTGCRPAEQDQSPAGQEQVNDNTDGEEPTVHSEGGIVPGKGWIGPLVYNVSGMTTLGPLSVEQDNLHRYDKGKFNGPTVIEVWGVAHNNAHELIGSAEYSNGTMGFYVLVRYEDEKGNFQIAADSREMTDSGNKIMASYGPGTHEYHVIAVIPANVRQVKGRSTIVIEIYNMPAWSSGGNNVAINLQYE